MDVTGRTLRPARRREARLAVALLTVLLMASSAPAHGDVRVAGAYVAGEPRVEAELLIGSQPEDPETATRVGVLFDLAPGWHLYWKNPGATGLPTELSFRAEGGQTGPIEWPAPLAFEAGLGTGAQSYGYANQVLLSSEIAFAGAPPNTVSAEVDVLVCDDECIPAHFTLERGLALDSDSAARANAIFERYAARVPKRPAALGVELEAHYSQSVIRPGDAFDAAIAVHACRIPARTEDCTLWRPDAGGDELDHATHGFQPDLTEPIELTISGIAPHPLRHESHLIELAGSSDGDEPIELDRLRGVLWLRNPAGERAAIEVDLPLPSAALGAPVAQLGRHWASPPAAPPEREAGLDVWRALLLAFIGGLVLNLMPCVLPVLAIKVFSISEMARAAHGRREVLGHGVSYTSGVLASMLALGLVVVALRSAGESVGWGFQFQDPLYVAVISTVLVAFALNLFGVYEISLTPVALNDVGQQATGLRRSFFEGLLAVALATPCTAPFLGTAVGFAFASEPATILGVFLAIGLGLALPFALVTLVPAGASWVPRSGPWLLRVRAGLGFTLLGTVVWLLSILGATGGTAGIIALLMLLGTLSFSLWLFGETQRGNHPRLTLLVGAGVAVVGIAGLNGVSASVAAPTASSPGVRERGNSADASWNTWSHAAVSEALEAKQPVFVRFTADWCVTCKVNERVVLKDDEVAGELERLGFARLVADWTRRDESIRAELARHGRAGVPLYLVYAPEQPDQPTILPELLTGERVIRALREAAATGDADH